MAEDSASSVAASHVALAAHVRAFVERVFPALDQNSYYQLLNLTPTADEPSIRSAFYRVSTSLHPDRFFGLSDGGLREQLETIYARVVEGYRVLSTPDKRALYDRGLKEGKLRLSTSDRDRGGPASPEESLKHPEAKKFFRFGLLCAGKKDWKGAVMNYNFAKTFEPDSAVLAEKLAEAQAALKAASGK